MNNKQDKGFTLVELLIVIVILGILATVTVFAVRGITDRGQDNACDVEGRSIQTAIEAFFVDNDQTDPGSLAALVPDYIKEDPSARWTFVSSGGALPGPDGDITTTADNTVATSASVYGTATCAGF